MTALIVGAAGAIGRLVLEECRERDIPVRGMVRREAQQAELRESGCDVVLGDLEGEFEAALQGVDTVVFTAGSGPKTGAEKTLLVDLWGGIRMIEAAERRGLSRFIMVSSFKADDPLQVPRGLRPYMVARNAADYRLRQSTVPWTLLRPARLTDEPGTGRIATHFDLEQKFTPALTIPRQDVAEVLVQVLACPLAPSVTLDLVSGEGTIEQVLSAHR